MRRGIAELARIWFAAGARAVISPYARIPVLDLRGRPRRSSHRARLRPYDLVLTSVHPHASVPIGRTDAAPRPPRRRAPRRARPLRRGRLRDPGVDRRSAAGDDHGVRDRDRGGRARRGAPVTGRAGPTQGASFDSSPPERAPRAPRARPSRDRAAARPGRPSDAGHGHAGPRERGRPRRAAREAGRRDVPALRRNEGPGPRVLLRPRARKRPHSAS